MSGPPIRTRRVRFVRLPALFNQVAQMHAQIYFTQEILSRNGMLRGPGCFSQCRIRRVSPARKPPDVDGLDSQVVQALRRFKRSNFDKTWKSFEVNQMMRVSGDLVRRYGINSVPTIVVNGKYRTSAADAGGYDELIELIDELTVREGLR